MKVRSTKIAPLPKRGLLKAVFDTIEGLGGASEQEVYKYLPAAITVSNQVVTHKKLKASLVSGVYRGFLIHDSANHKYRIAPMSYYKARMEYIDNLEHQHTQPRRMADKLPEPERGDDLPVAWWVILIIFIAMSSFLAGFVVGVL
jgi:hypothetical protein